MISKPRGSPKRMFSFGIPEDLLQALHKIALEEERSIASVIRVALKLHVENCKRLQKNGRAT